jgi:hypothetical protein
VTVVWAVLVVISGPLDDVVDTAVVEAGLPLGEEVGDDVVELADEDEDAADALVIVDDPDEAAEELLELAAPDELAVDTLDELTPVDDAALAEVELDVPGS